MTTVILSFVILALVMAGMAVGVILSNKPIKGSCGGIAALGLGQACDICGGDQKKCDSTKEKTSAKSLKAAQFFEAK